MSELSQEAQALIDSVSKLDDPSAEDRARVRQRLACSLGAAAFTTLAVTTHAAEHVMKEASSSLLGGAKAGWWTATSKLALGAAVLSGGLWAGWPSSEARPKVAPYELRAPEGAPRPERHAIAAPVAEVELAAGPVAPVVAPPPSAPMDAVEESSPRVERVAQKLGPPANRTARAEEPLAEGAKNSLTQELLLLAQGEAALRSGRAEQALRVAHEHQARFPTGVLREERLGIEALAECDMGHKNLSHAEAFLRAAPDSPLSARVRKACGLE